MTGRRRVPDEHLRQLADYLDHQDRVDLIATERERQAARDAASVVEELIRLRKAIRDHRDSRGHDRCWQNDLDIYVALGEPTSDPRMPPRDQFLQGCAAYYDGQCQKGRTPDP